MNHLFARPARRALLVGISATAIGATAAPTPASAQLRTSWDANASAVQFDGAQLANLSAAPPAPDTRWLGQRAIGAALQFNRPLLQLSADGLMRYGDVSSRATGGISALFATPSWNGFRVSVTTSQRHVPSDGMPNLEHDPRSLALWIEQPRVPTSQSRASANISYARNSFGAWVRATNRSGAGTSDSLSRWAYASGLNYQLRSVVFGISMGMQRAGVSRRWANTQMIELPPHSPGNPTDSVRKGLAGDSGYTNGWQRWSEAAATVGWASGRFTLDATFNARPKLANNQATAWGEASASIAVNSRLAIVSSLRTTPPLPGVLYAERRVASVGMRVARPSFWRPVPPSPVRSVTRSFNVKANAPGEYTITLTVPNARSVELAGDFTAWKAVALRQVNATRWEIVLKVDPGSHRCNVRIDGADWVAPPGVPAINDEFNGRVGLFVAQ